MKTKFITPEMITEASENLQIAVLKLLDVQKSEMTLETILRNLEAKATLTASTFDGLKNEAERKARIQTLFTDERIELEAVRKLGLSIQAEKELAAIQMSTVRKLVDLAAVLGTNEVETPELPEPQQTLGDFIVLLDENDPDIQDQDQIGAMAAAHNLDEETKFIQGIEDELHGETLGSEAETEEPSPYSGNFSED